MPAKWMDGYYWMDRMKKNKKKNTNATKQLLVVAMMILFLMACFVYLGFISRFFLVVVVVYIGGVHWMNRNIKRAKIQKRKIYPNETNESSCRRKMLKILPKVYTKKKKRARKQQNLNQHNILTYKKK